MNATFSCSFIHENVTFDWCFHFYVCELAYLKNELHDSGKFDFEKLIELNDYKHSSGMAFQNREDSESVIWIRNPARFSSVAHECIHAALYCLDSRGIDVTSLNDEVLCYLVGELVDAFYKRLCEITGIHYEEVKNGETK